jgi:hypothetical protein
MGTGNRSPLLRLLWICYSNPFTMKLLLLLLLGGWFGRLLVTAVSSALDQGMVIL